jgi:hypothetical protein
MMVNEKRFSVAISLAGYLLAATAIHFLHDHSAGGHCCGEVAGHVDCDDGPSHPHSGHGFPPINCEDSCFACRFHAVKSIAPVIATVVEQIEVVRLVEWSRPVFTPGERPALPLSRGPPRV